MNRQKPELALAMEYAAAMEACTAYIAVRNPAIREPEAAYRLVRPLLTAATGGDRQESFFAILLDTKNRIIGAPRECTRGLLDSSPVHPREVFREAVRDSAASVILAHNHPLCRAQHKQCYAEMKIMLSCGRINSSTVRTYSSCRNSPHAITQHNFVEFSF